MSSTIEILANAASIKAAHERMKADLSLIDRGIDLLDMAYINSLPQPFIGRMLGSGSEWPIHDFEVETGLVRIDVCGLLEAKHIGDFTAFMDGAGVWRSSEAFYVGANEEERAAIAKATKERP